MNQILFDKNNNEATKDTIPAKKNYFKIYKFQILLSTCVLAIISLTSYYFYFWHELNNKEQISDTLKYSFNIQKLYSENNNYVPEKTLQDYISTNSNFSVIGLIEISKIDISYPILSNINDELLKIAPCRFYGPLPNEVGNLCIAGHNYKNSKFFSKLKKLKNGDTIKITDLSGNTVEYIIYNTFETNYEDISCINQDTNNKKEITLITCNNIKDTRTVIKAKERD